MNEGLRNFSRACPDRIRAWVVFDGTTGTMIQTEGVRSVTRNSAGIYTIELDVEMDSEFWPCGGFARSDGTNWPFVTGGTAVTSNTRNIRVYAVTTAPAIALFDSPEVTFFVIGSPTA